MFSFKSILQKVFPYSENIAVLQNWPDGNTIHVQATEMTLAQEPSASYDGSRVNSLLMAQEPE